MAARQRPSCQGGRCGQLPERAAKAAMDSEHASLFLHLNGRSPQASSSSPATRTGWYTDEGPLGAGPLGHHAPQVPAPLNLTAALEKTPSSYTHAREPPCSRPRLPSPLHWETPQQRNRPWHLSLVPNRRARLRTTPVTLHSVNQFTFSRRCCCLNGVSGSRVVCGQNYGRSDRFLVSEN